jgi:DNA-binding transcriptional ArsR family regulator
MSDEKSVLVSLGDSRLKEISEVIGNKTCNKILDFLAENNATVSDISRELGIPLNTADYNIKKLTSAGLIEKSSHFWSIKGKKMPVYKLSNKKIVISPKRTKSILSLLLAFGIMGILAFALRWNMMGSDSNPPVFEDGSRALMAKVYDSESAVGTLDVNSGDEGNKTTSKMDAWEWFLIGAWIAIVVLFVISYIDERRSKK